MPYDMIKIKMEQTAYPLRVFYDGSCGICRREMEFYKNKDAAGHLELIDISQPDFQAADQGLSPAAVQEAIHVKDAQGNLAVGVDGFIRIWQAIGYKFLPWLVGLPFIKPLARICYAFFARYRYFFSGQKTPVCSPEKCKHNLL